MKIKKFTFFFKSKVTQYLGFSDRDYEEYACIIRFKNNYGRSVDKAYFITAADNRNASLKSGFVNTAVGESKVADEDSYLLQIYPNPNKGVLNLKFVNHQVKNIKICKLQGLMCYQAFNIKQSEFSVDMSCFVNGVYIVSAELNNKLITKKIILQK